MWQGLQGMGCSKLLAEGGMTGGDILILKVNFGRGLLMCIQIQSNKKNNNTYLEKVSKNQRGREQETLYLFISLFSIYYVLLFKWWN